MTMQGAELPTSRRMRIATIAMLCLVAALFGVSRAAAAGKQRRHHPHRQSLGGRASEASVPITAAPPVVGGKGGGTDPGNDYPARWKNAPQDSVLDAWMEYNRECTSFVAWALHSRNGFEMPFYRNANRWGPEAQRRGYVVNSVPAVGSVAWLNTGAFGHVAYVVAVNGANVTVEEYNFTVRGGYDKRAVSAAAFTGFIHFKDLAPPVTIPAPEPTGPVTPVVNTPAPITEVKAPAPTSFTETAAVNIGTFWSDYTVPSVESEGGGMKAGESIQVTCVVAGDPWNGNVWWYRTFMELHERALYAHAGSFFNGGTDTAGEHNPPVDPAVPPC
jgi:surface antigen